ncbi:hypothetical protein GPJ56_001022 [Histomonas meleagridis]|uniref:uncharacterized protein n=1 Tax=Histomonas meleagridis TaxID=135588 RepID=UPI003559EBFB|nr:hypothetical protein GPJ56_001022 [Histomonas meleagridis]KAH0804665.1 hypothetical protein GO595_002530 [Histomonas meleagridis]
MEGKKRFQFQLENFEQVLEKYMIGLTTHLPDKYDSSEWANKIPPEEALIISSDKDEIKDYTPYKPESISSDDLAHAYYASQVQTFLNIKFPDNKNEESE